MLFPYIYVPHKIEKMHGFIDFIFYAVWCQAPAKGEFGLALFEANPDLHGMMKDFYYDHSKGGDFFYGHVEGIYKLFSKLSPCQTEQFRLWYRGNNDIENICANDLLVHAIRYKDLFDKFPALSKSLATFFRGLYDKSLLGLESVKSRIGDIKDHNTEFFKKNKVGKCPFCGINDLKGLYHTRRDAYDHYLPKFRYPFNTINFRNLAPACHECNSSYKLSKDPIHIYTGKSVSRRKAFFPYAGAGHSIQIVVTLRHPNIDAILPKDITLQFGPTDVNEEIDTWKEVYGIEERYKAKFCGENDGKYWLTQVLDEWKWDGRLPDDFMTTLARQANDHPFAECRFLKKPFLEACQSIGAFP
ncbi:MAG: hypothetical protein CFE44_04890 [Burkholderiales bacterium PBB4]|nr:MAG: hypothetical protein CFE44_04890 [Burkholderiales bacterium PBB4]